jgi:hypothetical protein
MKQSEIDREARLLAKAEAKARRWKSIGSTQYWTIGPLFFELVVSASAKEGTFYFSLRFKWLDLDQVLWRVLGMSSNEHEPFSLHANGAFVLTGWEVHSMIVRELAWQPGVLAQQIQIAAQQAGAKANEVALQVDSLDSYVEFLERDCKTFMQKHPRAAITVWKEKLLAAMLRGDKAVAAEIAKARIAANDSGGFSSGGKSFYERSLALNAT